MPEAQTPENRWITNTEHIAYTLESGQETAVIKNLIFVPPYGRFLMYQIKDNPASIPLFLHEDLFRARYIPAEDFDEEAIKYSLNSPEAQKWNSQNVNSSSTISPQSPRLSYIARLKQWLAGMFARKH